MPERRAAARLSHLRWWLAGGVALLLLAAYHAWWLVRVRHHASVDIDEAGYLSIALNDLAGLRVHGLHGLWDAFQQQPPSAPLVPLLAVPALAIHKAVLSAYSVEIAALVVVVLASFGIVRRLAGPRWAALGALTVAGVPGVIAYAREFSFALPCTAALAVSLWALLRSGHLARRRWALLWGLGGGAAALARTMAIGYLPGLALAGLLWAAVAAPPVRRAALRNALAGVLAGVALAAVWYWRNLSYVLDYLRGYGYGATADQYGTRHSILSAAWWYNDLRVATEQILYAPLLLVLALVAVCGLVTLAPRIAATGGRGALAAAIRSPATPLAIVVLSGYLALATTANNGSAFALPLVPPTIALAVALVARLPLPALRVGAAAAFVLVTALQLMSFAQVGGPLDRIRLAHAWPFPSAPIVDPRVLAVQAVGVTTNELTFGPRDRGWIELAGGVRALAGYEATTHGRFPILAFASRDRLLNTNTVELAELLSDVPSIPMAQLTTAQGDTAVAYRRFLLDPRDGQPNVLAISDGERNDFEPTVTQARVVIAARSLGFAPFASLRQPNGERVRLWWLRRGPAIPMPPARSASR